MFKQFDLKDKVEFKEAVNFLSCQHQIVFLSTAAYKLSSTESLSGRLD